MDGNFEDAQTKPTIETVLERINTLGENFQDHLTALRSDVGLLKSQVDSLRNEFQLFRGEMEIRIDRIAGRTNPTRGVMLNLRADFREWKDQLKELMA